MATKTPKYYALLTEFARREKVARNEEDRAALRLWQEALTLLDASGLREAEERAVSDGWEPTGLKCYFPASDGECIMGLVEQHPSCYCWSLTHVHPGPDGAQADDLGHGNPDTWQEAVAETEAAAEHGSPAGRRSATSASRSASPCSRRPLPKLWSDPMGRDIHNARR